MRAYFCNSNVLEMGTLSILHQKGCVILLKFFRHCFGEIFEEKKQEILQIWTLKFQIQDKREIKG